MRGVTFVFELDTGDRSEVDSLDFRSYNHAHPQQVCVLIVNPAR